ncbi:MAG: uracil-DNA glycosylase [Gammaproteobacteria bacterium AqS3]|nr:uracil-DNA glycosylase [Gammaproteobacteria bacterium AqS3]
MSSQAVLRSLRQMRFDNVFNPYTDRCPVYDRINAPLIRGRCLGRVLRRAAATRLDAIWVGRDLGHRGGRRTGLAFADDVNLPGHLARWGLRTQRATSGEPMAETTAAVIWDVLRQIESPIFLWNIFPLHPHRRGEPFSNRTHNAQEGRAGEELLIRMIEWLAPRRVIAVGGDAFAALSRRSAGVEVVRVRHPSYGGRSEFLNSMRGLYGLEHPEAPG